MDRQHSFRKIALCLTAVLAALMLLCIATAAVASEPHNAAKKGKEEQLEILDVSVVDLAWGLLAATGIGAVGGLIYAALTNPPPSGKEEEAG